MGFLKRLFAGDPGRDLERAEALLESGEAERALELARRAEEGAEAADQDRARALIAQAREAMVTMALEKASLAESSEYFEDAVEWLDVALEHAGEERRSELAELRRSLQGRAEEMVDESWEPPSEPENDSQTQMDPGVHYQALIDMLIEDVADLYQTRTPAFRVAYVALNEGRLDEAHEAFEALAAISGEDPVVRFELGRSRLAVGDAEGAVPELEAAWPALGDQAMDLTGELSVPALWADAMLATGRPAPVIERLADLTDPIDAAPLCERYAQALLATERFEEARDFLARASAKNGARDHFAFQLAQALAHLGERAAAIDCLEVAIKPSCTTGCAPRAKYLPSFRALASLYLDDESHSDRVHELMTDVARAQGGRLASGDHLLLARYYDQTGDAGGAEHARDHARRLRQEAETEAGDAGPALGAQMRTPI